jgi:hypothetical protein
MLFGVCTWWGLGHIYDPAQAIDHRPLVEMGPLQL